MTSKFGVVPTLAILDKSISHAELRVFALLCSYADKNGQCYPSQSTMAESLNISRQKLNPHIKSLETKGWVKITGRVRDDGSRRSNLYHIVSDGYMACPREGDMGSATEGDSNNTPPINIPPMIYREEISEHELLVDKQEAGMSEHTNEIDIDDFAIWWASYPRQINRKKAQTEYRKARDLTDAGNLLRASEAYAREVMGTELNYIKRPDNWLKEKLWESYQPAPDNLYNINNAIVSLTAEQAAAFPHAVKLKGK